MPSQVVHIAEPMPVAYAPAWAPVALTARGTAACRLSEFQDCWAAVSAEDRAWFAEDLRNLLVDAVVEMPEVPGRG